MNPTVKYILLDFLLTVVITAGVWAFGRYVIHGHVIIDAIEPNAATLFGSLTTASSSLLGFIIAAVAIVISQLESSLGKLLREAGQLSPFLTVYKVAIYWFAITCGWSLLAIFLCAKTDWLFSMLVVTTFLIVGSALSIHRCITVLLDFCKAKEVIDRIT